MAARRGARNIAALNDKTKDMGKRVRISNDSLNSYGTRILTAGMDIEQYRRNPVLLYMHERGQVIGYVKDIKADEGEVTGEPVFDEATELSRRCKIQWEVGSLRMVSAGLDILETSEEPALLVQGQTRPTITRSKLFEVSLVDVGANDDAIVLQKDGKTITLGKEGECLLPMLNNHKNEKRMELKQIALMLGLAETATEAEVKARIEELLAAKQENETLRADKENLVLASLTAAVDKAVSEKRLARERKEEFVALGKQVGLEKLESVLAAMNPQMKLSGMLNAKGGVPHSGFAKLGEVPADELMRLRDEHPEEYKRLYKAEYGMECEF